MEQQRKTDKDIYSKYRPSRFCKDGGQWYYATREGTLEGPYQARTDAEAGLNAYIKLMASGFMPRNAKLAVEPLAVQAHPESPPLH